MRRTNSIIGIAFIFLVSLLLTFQFRLYPLIRKINILNYNINSGMSAMKQLALNSYSKNTEKYSSSSSSTNNRIKANLILFWSQEHRDNNLYNYSDSLLDNSSDTSSSGTNMDTTNLALLLLDTNGNVPDIKGNGVKTYSVIRGISKYAGYRLVLVALNKDIDIDNIELENIDINKNIDNSKLNGITLNNNLAFIEQNQVAGISRIEYDTYGNEQLVLNYTFDIIGDMESINNIRSSFNIDLVNKLSGEYFTDKFTSISTKFDNSKYLVEDKDFIECSVTLSLILKPEYMNSLLGDNSKINYKNIGYALNTFKNLFIIRVNNIFDIELQ